MAMPSFLKPETSCAVCTRTGKPLVLVEVPYFENAAVELCDACLDDWRRGGRRPLPFEPSFRVDRAWRWPRPSAEDALLVLARVEKEIGATGALGREPSRAGAEAAVRRFHAAREEGRKRTELEVAEALAAAVILGEEIAPLGGLEDEVQRVAKSEATALLLGIFAHGTVASEKPPRRPLHAGKIAALDTAFREYLAHFEHPVKTELGARLAALGILVKLEQGEIADAERRLRDALAATERARIREPRLLLLRAIVHAEQSNLEGADRALEQCLRALDEPGAGAWSDVRAAALRAMFARAIDGGRFAAAKDALRAYVKLRPDDRAARFDLAHTYMKASLDAVAREVLASVLDPEARDLIRDIHEGDPRGEEGILLFATCLARLGEPARALALLADEGEVPELPGERLRSERCHLAGLAAHAVGKRDLALKLLAEAHDQAGGRATRALASDLVLVVQEEVRDRLDDLTADGLPALVELVTPHAAAFTEDYTPAGIDLARRFVGWEVGRGFKSHVTGPDPLDTARLLGAEASVAQTCILLAKRRLADALRKEREARASGASPVPVELLLTLLERLRRLAAEGTILPLE